MNFEKPTNKESKIQELKLAKLDIKDERALAATIVLENKIFPGEEFTPEYLKNKILKGEDIYVSFVGDKAIAMGSILAEADPGNKNIIKRNLPKESVFAGAAGVDPEYRGEGLHKELIEKRKEIAISLGKETIIGSVRPENGSSINNILTTGGRIYAYLPKFFSNSHNPGRLLWEIDTKLPTEEVKPLENKDMLSPSEAQKALENKKKQINLLIKQGEEVDVEAQKIISKILSYDYVGVAIKKLNKTPDDKYLSVLTFKHISDFVPEIAKRISERKLKIKDILSEEE